MRTLSSTLLALAVALPAAAQYKVVGPDGKVTYTDRPPTSDAGSRVAPMRGAAPTAPEPALPVELRQAQARFPVTIYTAADCAPCDSGRQMLVQRGVPFAEKRVLTDEDTRAYEQITGGRLLPALSVGPQVLRGLNAADWTAYLDAAGYPRESRLPAGWKPPAATPLVEAKVAPAAAEPSSPREAPAARRPAPAPAPTPPATTPATGIRF